MDNNYTELLTVDDLCDLLGCGYNTAYKLLGKKQIPSFKLGKNWRIPRQGVEKFILEQSGINRISQPFDRAGC